LYAVPVRVPGIGARCPRQVATDGGQGDDEVEARPGEDHDVVDVELEYDHQRGHADTCREYILQYSQL